jgi:hypothetical protein
LQKIVLNLKGPLKIIVHFDDQFLVTYFLTFWVEMKKSFAKRSFFQIRCLTKDIVINNKKDLKAINEAAKHISAESKEHTPQEEDELWRKEEEREILEEKGRRNNSQVKSLDKK